MARAVRYFAKLATKKSREAEVAELEARLMDPDDDYRDHDDRPGATERA